MTAQPCPGCGRPVDRGDVACASCGAQLRAIPFPAVHSSTVEAPTGGARSPDGRSYWNGVQWVPLRGSTAIRWTVPWHWIDVVGYLAVLALILFGPRLLLSGHPVTATLAGTLQVVLYLLLLALLVAVVHRRGGSLADLGWRRVRLSWIAAAPLIYLGGLAIEVILERVTVLILGHTPGNTQCAGVQFELGSAAPLIIISAVVLAPLVEESIIRGFLFPALRTVWSFWPAALLSAVVWSGGHVLLFAFLPFTGLGVLFAYLRERTGSIWPSVAVHAITNTFALVVIFNNGCR